MVPFRAKTALFNTRRSWFGPIMDPAFAGQVVEPPGTAPGSAAPMTRRTLSPYPTEAGSTVIGFWWLIAKPYSLGGQMGEKLNVR